YMTSCTDLGTPLFVLDVGTGTPRTLTRAPRFDCRNPRLSSDSTMDWSPDGSRLAFSSGGAIYVIDADGGHLRRQAAGSHPSWSPDGSRIVFMGDRGITLMDADGSHRVLLTKGIQPAWSPDGTKIAYVLDPL